MANYEDINNSIPATPLIQEIATQDSVLEGNTAKNVDTKHWLRRHKLALGLSAIALSAILSATSFNRTANDIEKDAPWAVPALAVTELTAWGGAGVMLMSGGKKIGNPFTVKSRLSQIATELENNQMYQRGFKLNVAGAAGTSAVLTVGALTSLPPESWPLAFGAAGASLAFSALPLRNVGKEIPQVGGEEGL